LFSQKGLQTLDRLDKDNLVKELISEKVLSIQLGQAEVSFGGQAKKLV